MKIISKFLLVLFCMLFSISFAQQTKDSAAVINTANKIVNEYTTLTADASAGSTTISVAASGLNANNRFAGPLAAGDLIMIIQMQGISVNGNVTLFSGTLWGTPVDNTWGQITNYNNCGNYEFAEVKAVPNTTSITLDCGLQHSYTMSGRVQVIRVPRYKSLTITSPGTITCPAWASSGFTGGVVSIEVKGNTIINNANGITVNGLGFRGGSIAGDNLSGTGGGQVARSDKSEGAEKGEGVYGYQADYDAIGGRYCRGAAGNAGGGANMHNAAGGGGANAGDISAWDGEGNPDVSVASWITAWNLEVSGTFATHTSSGGGRGGYSFAASNRDATVEGPRPFQSGATNNWGGDFRTNNGGWGGRPLDYSTGKIFLGGGGGAGDQDNNQAGDGGRGAGLVYLMSYGTVSGTGSISANGAVGINSGIDGAGGGGAGGTVIINSIGAISGISVSAKGGVGGNQVIPAFTTVQSEGPGGGGGGGYIAISNGAIAQNVTGGANGTTDASHLTEFPPNGATKGGNGLANQSITNFTLLVANDSVCAGNSITLNSSFIGTPPAGTIVTWYDLPTGGTLQGTGTSYTTPPLNANTTYYVGTCPGTFRIPLFIKIKSAPTIANAGAPQNICGTTTNLAGNNPTTGSGVWSLISGAGNITTPSSPTSGVTALGVGPNVFQWTITSSGCTSTSQVTITGSTPPTTSLAGSNQTICATTTNLSGNIPTVGTGLWTLVSGSGTITTPTSESSGVTGLGVGPNVFKWTISNGSCPSSSSQVTINVSAPPTTSNAGSPQTICGTTATLNANNPVVGTGVWTLISGTGTITTPSSPTSGITALGAGANVFEWKITNGSCPPSTSQVTITRDVPPTASLAGSDQTICTSTATLAGNNPTVGTGIWTLQSGSGTITTPTSSSSGVTGLGSGANVFVWTISNGSCPSSSSQVTINVTTPPSASVAGNPQTICGTTATLNGNNPAVGTGVWTLISGAGTITTPSSPTSGITGLGVGANVFEWTISNGACSASTSQVTITRDAAPTASIAGPDQTICASTATLAGNNPTVGTGLWTLQSGSGIITTPTSESSGVTGLGSGANVFVWTINNGSCPSSSSQVTINVSTPPTVSAAGSPQTICGTTATLNGNSPVVGTGIWTLISGAGTITTPSSPTSGITGLGAGPNVFEWTISNGSCTQSSSSVTITGETPPTSSVAGSNQTVCGNTTTLAGNTPLSGTGVWTLFSGSGTITSPTSPTSTVTGLGSGTNVFEWTISNGSCTPSTSQVIITSGTTANATITQPPSVCAGSASFTLTAATGGGTWSGVGINSVTGLFDPSIAGVGTDTIKYSFTGSCNSMDTVVITVIANSNATINNVLPVCENDLPFNLSAATSGGTWSGTGITDFVNGIFDPSIGAGSYTIGYATGGVCPGSDNQIVIVKAKPTPGFAAVGITSGCAPLCIQFNESAGTVCSTLNYQFGDLTSSLTSSPLHCYTQPGVYSVSVTCTDNGCSGTTTINNMITVLPTPSADFTMTPSGIVGTNTVISVNDISTSGGNQLWNFGDPASSTNTSTFASDSHTYAIEGNYCIQLISSNSSGCVDSTSKCIVVANDAEVMIPNIFTPNGDGKNDLFYINASGVKELSLSIYDRWGLKITELNATGVWDGKTSSGSPASDGVYYYILKGKSTNEKPLERKGFIQLLSQK